MTNRLKMATITAIECLLDRGQEVAATQRRYVLTAPSRAAERTHLAE